MKFLALSGWLVAAAAMYLAQRSAELAIEASAEAREAQLISCELMQTQARLLGWDLAPDCRRFHASFEPRGVFALPHRE